MTGTESTNPFRGDAIIRHLPAEAGAIVAASDDLSEMLVAPFVEAAAGDFSSLPPERQAILLEWRAEADASRARFDAILEEQRLAAGITKEAQQQGFRDNLRRAFGLAISPDNPDDTSPL